MNKDHQMRRSNLKMALFAAFLAGAAMLGTADARPANSAIAWVGSWASSQQIPEPRNALDPEDLHDATLRQVVHLSIGGSELRVRLSNAFGTEPLHVTAVRIAKPLSRSTGSIDASTDRVLTFSGTPDATIPAGADYVSDPIAYPITALSDLAVSIYLETPPEQQTSHPGSRATSFFVHGNHAADVDLLNAKQVDHWFQISGVDVTAIPQAAAVVTLGDSITEQHLYTNFVESYLATRYPELKLTFFNAWVPLG